MANKKNFYTIFLFLLIVILSSIFRLTNMDVVEFKSDEAINLFLASRPIFGHPFAPGSSVSSLGILNFPFFNYILYPVVLFTLDPKKISFFIALINSLSVGFFFLLVKKYYGLYTALISAVFLSFSPWMILFSRKIWSPDLIFPFLVPFLYSLHKIIIEKKLIYWIGASSLALFLIQIHHILLFFLSILFIFLILNKVKIKWRFFSIGLLIGIIPTIPYFIYQFSGCFDCNNLFAMQTKLAVHPLPLILVRPLQIINTGHMRFILGNDMLTLANNFPFVYKLINLFYIEYLLIPLGIIIYWKKFHKLRSFAYSVLLLPFVFFILKIETLMHYFIVLVPFLFIFLGTAFTFLISRKNNFIRISSLSLLFVLIISSISFNYAFFDILTRQKMLKGDYGTSFAIGENVEKIKFQKLKNNPNYEEILIESRIPKSSIFGNSSLGKSIFGQDKNEDLSKLEKMLKENPDDSRIQNETIYFFTQSAPDIKTINYLRDKARQYPQYLPIYSELYPLYLRNNFRKVYVSKNLGIAFEYPQHWRVEENKNNIILKVDDNVMVLKKDEGNYNLFFEDKRKSLTKNKENEFKEMILKSIRYDLF